MGAQLEFAKSRLFDADAIGASNIKLFPGHNRDATPEQLSAELNKVITQLEAGDYDLVNEFDD